MTVLSDSAHAALPRPGPGFAWVARPWGPTLECSALRSFHHGFTTRGLGLRDDEPGHWLAWTSLAASVGVPPERVVRPVQVHGRACHVVTPGGARPRSLRPAADAIVSAEPRGAVAVLSADCVPILLADRRRGTVAAVHAGWRGTAAGVVGAAIRTMVGLGTRLDHVVVALGPSIGPCCYTVGEELIQRFADAGHAGGSDAWFSMGPDRRLRLDLWAANRDQVAQAGVAPESIHASSLCTACHTASFHSYRVQSTAAGRMAAIIRPEAR